MSALTVRMYNVGFGDAILISVPDRVGGSETTRHVIVDLGNLIESDAEVFGPVAVDIMKRTGGKPVDLYVMTHEHLDHVQGLKYASGLGHPIPVDYVWMTASADPDYQRRFPHTKRAIDALHLATDRLRMVADRRGLTKLSAIEAFFLNNDYRTTSKCVAHIREAARVKTSYVHRRFPLRAGRDHPFREAKLRVLAPEQDSSVYYGRIRPLAVAPDVDGNGAPATGLEALTAPDGIDPAAFANLMSHLEGGLGDQMLAIDKAKNETSLVLQIEWRGWRLLFPGDAEHKSWRMMHRKKKLQPVHFLKVAHHGSITGMPDAEILDAVLPPDPHDDRPRYAAVSTHPGHWDSVPDADALGTIDQRVAKLYDTRDVEPGACVEVEFPDPPSSGGG